jgi:uncharacterized membrane protein YeaQ/YmgE (transglycosylase-associated protein family)
MQIVWVIIIGFVAGIIARFLAPGPNNPAGFMLTTLIGIAGPFVATLIGQTIGWYGPNQGAGLLGAVVGAIIVLFVWHRLVTNRLLSSSERPSEAVVTSWRRRPPSSGTTSGLRTSATGAPQRHGRLHREVDVLETSVVRRAAGSRTRADSRTRKGLTPCQ